MKILDLGSGKKIFKLNPRDKTITLDIVKSPNVDVVWDMEKTPLPFKDNEFDYVRLRNVIEHISPSKLENLIFDVHRILKPNGIFDIIAPWFSSSNAFSSLVHFKGLSYTTFDGYEMYRIEKKHIIFGIHRYTKPFNLIINPIVNSIPRFYQRFLCWVIPCEQIEFKLKAIK